MKLSLSFLVLPVLAWHACQPALPTGPIVEKSKDFDAYWHQGKAEITTYDLYQARYGEMREGEAVVIFVTEEHDKEKQVKLESRLSPRIKK